METTTINLTYLAFAFSVSGLYAGYAMTWFIGIHFRSSISGKPSSS